MPLRRASARTAGLLLSAGILVVFAGVVTFFVIRNPQVRSAAVPPPDVAPDPALVPTTSGPTTTAASRFGGGSGFQLQIVDKNDPSLVRAELSAARSTPIEGQMYRVALEEPVIWYFLKDGRTVHARADKGTAYLPDQGAAGTPGRPQDGIMEGNVVARVYEARADGSRPRLDIDEPMLEARTQTVKFDAELGSVEAPERVEVRHAAVDFTGAGVMVLYNDARGRLELLSIARPERLATRPRAAGREDRVAVAPRPASARTGAAATPRPTGNGGTTPAAQAAEVMYHLISEGPGSRVTVTQGERTITSETMEVWARLVNNELRPGAIMTSNLPPARAAAPARTPGSTAAREAAAPQPAVAAPAPSAISDSDEPVVITWTGPLKIVPIAGAPELTYNDVLARFTSASDHGVTISDSEGKTTGSGSLLEYGASRREVVLAGRAGARLESQSSGAAEAERFELSLVTGIARVPGAGSLVGRADDRSLAWDNQAEFHFRLDDRKEVTEVVTKVIADGAVRAADGDSSLSGGALHATLVPVGESDSRLQTLSVIGKAQAREEGGGSLAADTLDVSFVPAPGKPSDADPSKVVARGGVRAERDGSVLEASTLDTLIARTGEKNELTATRIDAAEVVFTDESGTRAEAPRLTADPVARVARLEGPAGSVRVSREGATIEGEDMTFRDVERRLAVAGPGKLTHNSQAKGEEPVTAVIATWTESMSFDDLAGTATCIGGAEAVMTRAQGGAITQRDRMQAQRVDLWLTPAGAPDAPPQDRTLRRAELTGGEKPATVESRRYARPQPGAEAAVEQLMYLESARIDADDEKGTLVTPAPGKFLVLDRRAAADARPGQGPLEAGGGRGTSLFTWTGSMDLNRDRGVVTLREGVKLTHQRAGDNVKSELDCEKLTAVIKVDRDAAPGGAADPACGMTGELISAEAEGGVWMRANGRELIADEASYDAVNRVLTARARGSNLVQLFDPGATEPRTSRGLRWDMATDRIDIFNPGTTTSPR
jgi:lipopolysaccharide export system protein LptA